MKRTHPWSPLPVAIRGHRIECTLVVVAAVLFAWASQIRPNAIVRVRRSVELAANLTMDRDVSTRVDATFQSVMIEFSGARWRVVPESVQTVATLGKARFEVEHISRQSVLYPRVEIGWPVGGGRLRRSEPLWSVRSVCRMGLDEDAPGRATLVMSTLSDARWLPEFRTNEVPLDRVVIPAGFDTDRYLFDLPVAGRNMLPLAIATTDPTFDPTAIDMWKQHVRADVQALARRERHEVDATRELRAKETAMSCALAALLGVPECAGDLDVIRQLWEVPATARDGATDSQSADMPEIDVPGITRESRFALIGGGDARSGTRMIEHLAERFTPEREFLARIARSPSRPDDVRAAARHALMRIPTVSSAPTEYPRAPLSWMPWALFTALMVPLGIVATRRPEDGRPRYRVRRRDLLAFWMVGILASTNIPLWGPFTTATPGLIAFALVLFCLRRDPRTSLPTRVPASLLVAAGSLPIADALVVPGLDAIARALCFATVSWLALRGLEPLPSLVGNDDTASQVPAPRRPAPRRRWPVVQVLAATLAISSLLVALVEPMDWTEGWPRLHRWLDAIAVAAVLAAGLVAYGRKPGAWRPRPDPLVCVGISLGAAIHLTFVTTSVVDSGSRPLAHELAFLTAVASATLLAFAFVRVGLFVRRMRHEVT